MDHNLAVRIRSADIDPAVYDYISPVPLFDSGTEAAAHGLRDLAAPGPDAVRKIRQVGRIQASRKEGHG